MDFFNNETMEQMTATLAHEVKNPVALIKANIEYMQVNDKTGLYEKNYGVIKKELEKISGIVMDFIRLAKPSEIADRELIFVSDMLSEVMEELDIPFSDKNIEIEFECFDEELKIFGVYSKINIVLFNLYKNAFEAIEDSNCSNGYIKTTVERKGDFVVIDICDNGGGINNSIEKEIGTPFLTTKVGGSGLGLPICKKLIEEHGGKFTIMNNENEGCTAKVCLPLI